MERVVEGKEKCTLNKPKFAAEKGIEKMVGSIAGAVTRVGADWVCKVREEGSGWMTDD